MNEIYIYFGVFLGVIIEGEIALIAASLAAQKGYLNLTFVSLAAIAGTLFSDWFYFFSGRIFGYRLLEKYSFLQNRIDKPKKWLQRNPSLIFFTYRYLYGLRIVTLIILGMSGVSARKFLTFSFTGIILWTFVFCALGYYLGELINNYILRYEGFLPYIIIGVLTAVVVILLVRKGVRKLLGNNNH
jgi:membrane protein DedA with SNARE-associated domain